jgi:hypothetical protein
MAEDSSEQSGSTILGKLLKFNVPRSPERREEDSVSVDLEPGMGISIPCVEPIKVQLARGAKVLEVGTEEYFGLSEPVDAGQVREFGRYVVIDPDVFDSQKGKQSAGWALIRSSDKLVLGRKPPETINGMDINNPGISRDHVEISVGPSSNLDIYIKDLNTLNGTRVIFPKPPRPTPKP